ncbi:hypothetical protein CROQUDRAFT_664580 [Cronartium quercuum f. sp. fusiforme G11]|uniref:Uncharacterized protein n=1 Tax=Cronartium quercuum f. sp. fusiforme G11 TaxID=708437 RepID=A0A9P6T6I2_9BASI|nr:hypothetical protein CROQUDRAFT_664580 [Cronartium quercuum f. sp. fusiforme G11]
MSKQLHAHLDPRLLDTAAITLSTASLALVTPACILDPIIPAAQTQLNTTTHKDGWITSMHVESSPPKKKKQTFVYESSKDWRIPTRGQLELGLRSD